MSRHNTLTAAMTVWIKQFRPDITLDATNGYRASNQRNIRSNEYRVDCWGLCVRPSYYNGQGAKDEVLWQKAQITKGVVVLTDMDGTRWALTTPTAFTEVKPKRQLSQASKLKNRYRRGLITIPRQIQKMEDAINEQRLELPILTIESQRLWSDLTFAIQAFERDYEIKVKPYPYHQSIVRFANKMGGEKFAIMKEAFWALRSMRSRYEDLQARLRFIHRYVRSAERKIEKAKARQKKLSHGQDPNKKLSWEK